MLSLIRRPVAGLRFAQKFLLIAVMAFLPLAGFLAASIKDRLDAIRLDQHELAGEQAVRSLQPLLAALQRHRGSTSSLKNGVAAMAERQGKARSDVQAGLARLGELHATLAGQGIALESARFDVLGKQWQALLDGLDPMSAEDSFRQHTLLIEELMRLVHFIAVHSGLILDPEADTYMLMDLQIFRLPALAEHSGRLRGLSASAAAAARWTPADHAAVTAASEQVLQHAQTVDDLLTLLAGTRPEVAAPFADANRALQQEAKAFVAYIDSNLINAEDLSATAEDIFVAADKLMSRITVLATPLSEDFLKRLEQRTSGRKQALMFTVTGSLAMIGLMVMVLLAIYQSVRTTVTSLSQSASELAAGNLRQRARVDSQDELGEIAHSFNTVAESFQGAISQLSQAIATLDSQSSQLSRAADTANTDLSRQQGLTEQVAAAVTEMSATVGSVAQSTERAAGEAKSADDSARAGASVVEQSVRAVMTLADQVRNAAQTIEQLAQEAQAIGSVVDVIRNIAGQTNLLALNAAIEAARAGEQGRGFAVVADEVRTLASRTHKSTEEIQAMIERLQSAAAGAATVMERGSEASAQVVERAQQAGTALDTITASVLRIAEMNGQIAHASDQQQSVAAEVNRDVETIRMQSQHILGEVQRVSSAAGELKRIAGQLADTVQHFRT